jgi:broad specificity phosphatase PhoE
MSKPALILVRHGRPAIDPDTSPTTWPLCDEGRKGCAKIVERVTALKPTRVVASPEPKALQTAQILAAPLNLEVEVDPGLHEHKRQHVSFGTEQEFRERIAEAFAEPSKPAPGGESPHEACERLAATLARHRGDPLLAVSHGTVMSLYLAEKLGLDAHDLWRSLHMPDVFVLDADGALIERIS